MSSRSPATIEYPPSTRSVRADVLAAGVPARSWQLLSAGAGAKGPRFYAWAWIAIAEPGAVSVAADPPEHSPPVNWRSTAATHPTPVALADLVRVAGTRWAVEECFQTAKDQVGLDQYQVRGWTGWHRFITLAMLALAVLTVMAAQSRPATPSDPVADTHIAMTIAEVRRLFNALVTTVTGNAAKTLKASLWRRKVQATARRSHYRRRLATG